VTHSWWQIKPKMKMTMTPKLIKISFQDGAICDDGEANTICAIFPDDIRLTRLHWKLMESLRVAGTSMKVMKGAP
jgi:hypothetical protein